MAEARWYPSSQQLGSPADLERAFREVLRLHYGATDKLDDLHKTVHAIPSMAGTKASQVPNTAAVTNILGLPIVPSDTTELADGTKLTYVRATRSFQFK